MANKQNAEAGFAGARGSVPWTHFVINRNTAEIVSRHRTLSAARNGLDRVNRYGDYAVVPANAMLCTKCHGVGWIKPHFPKIAAALA